MGTQPIETDTAAPPPSTGARGPEFVAGVLAVLGAAWLVVDAIVTARRLPPVRPTGRTAADSARAHDLADGFELRMWVLFAVAALAVGLAVAGIARSPDRGRVIANGVGIAAALWTGLAAILVAVADEAVMTDRASLPVLLSIALAIGAAVVLGIVTRRVVRGAGADPVAPERRRTSRPLVVAGVTAVAAQIVVLVIALTGADACTASRDATKDGALAWIAILLGGGGLVLGLVLVALRRWAVGLVVGAGAVTLGIVGLMFGLRCLS